MSSSARQVSLRVHRSRSGRPAALFVRFGGRAGEGGAASGESASRQRVPSPHILRRRRPGPKVKTIPLCTSLPTHSCTVTIILLVGLLLICWLYSFILSFIFYFFLLSLLLLFISWYLESPHSSDKMAGVRRRACAC